MWEIVSNFVAFLENLNFKHSTNRGLHDLNTSFEKKIFGGVCNEAMIINKMYFWPYFYLEFYRTFLKLKGESKVAFIGQFVISKSDPKWGST